MRLQQALRCGVILVGTLSCPTSAFCGIFPIPDIAKLTNSSSVIVVGEVLSVVRVGSGEIPMPDGKPYECESITAFIRVDEVLKGEGASGIIQLNFLHNAAWEGGPLTNGLAERTYRMFFLKPDGDRYAFAAPQQSSMPMSRSRSALSASSNGDVYTQVLRHLAEGLFAEKDSSQDRVQSIFAIDFESSPIVTELFTLAINGPVARSDRAFRSQLIAALVRRKDVSLLPDLETVLLTNHDDALNNARMNMIYALQQIDPSVSGPILIQALSLPEPQMRVAAAGALQHAPSNDAIAALFGSLNDPERDVRWSAMNTLASIFRESKCLPQPDEEELFRACVEHWKELAATQKLRSNR